MNRLGRIKFKLGFFLCLISLQASADRVNNGGELSEANLAIASMLFPELLQNCLDQSSCLTQKSDRELLQKLLAAYPFEKNENGELNYRFISAELNPGLFGPQAQALLWKTQAEVGAEIVFNSDLLPDQIRGRPHVLNVRRAFRILFMALASHHKIENFLYLDQLARQILRLNNELESEPSGPTFPLVEDVDWDGNAAIVPNNPYIHYVTAEEWIRFLWKNLNIYLELCLQSPNCVASPWDRQVLNGILENWADEVQIINLIRFESGGTHPEIFQIDGVIKTAVTGSQKGDPIYFNIDRIYTSMPPDNWRAPLKQETILSFLVHEAGHHLGILEHSKLDLLGYRISQFFQKTQPWRKFEEIYDNVLFHKIGVFNLQVLHSQLQASTPLSKSVVLMTDEMQGFQFNPYLEPEMNCPARTERVGFRVNEAFWTGRYSRFQEPPPTLGHLAESYQLVVDATLICQLQDGRKLPVFWRHQMDLGYSVVPFETNRKGYVFSRILGSRMD